MPTVTPYIQRPSRGGILHVFACSSRNEQRRQRGQSWLRVPVDPSALLHQHGISLDGLSDPSSMVAQAAQAIIANFDSMMHASDNDVAS